MPQHLSEIDTQEESQCRSWARENYVPLAERSLSWPLFVLDEMRRLDQPGAVKPPKLLLRVGRVPSDEELATEGHRRNTE